ncbi:MAG TPA: TonB-dependent receptor, partial [Blastocatellia bacterium]|nr:TonB-dependent receptor [Blastocatellia bacterium]
TAPDGDVGFGFAVNPKVAASFIVRRHQEGPVGATRLRGSYGHGMKEPRFDEAFSPSTFFLGNPLLDPERVRAFDFGVEQEFWGRRLSVEASYFDNRFRDIIVFRSDPLTFGPIELPDGRLANFINLDRASARGLELIGTLQPLRKLRLIGSYTFLRSRVEEAGPTLSPEVGLPLLRRARHSGTFEVSWIDERFDVKVDGSALGKRRDIDPIFGSRFDLTGDPFFNDGYLQMNAAGSYRITRRVAAFARIDNLLNQDYEEVLGFPANRFQITGGMRIRIGGDR